MIYLELFKVLGHMVFPFVVGLIYVLCILYFVPSEIVMVLKI
jgi:hypothetical protein